MRAARNRIALFGLFGTGNSGNDGSLEAMLAFLRRRRPDAAILCICGSPDNVRRMFGIDTTSIGGPAFSSAFLRLLDALSGRMLRHAMGFRRAVGIMRRCDILVMPGTGILDDFGEGAFSVPFVLLGWCLAARLAGAKVAFVSVGAGPIRTRLGRFFAKLATASAHYRSYRDASSRDFVRGLGIDVANDPIYPDLAFALPTPGLAPCGQARRPLEVGLGVMAYYGWADDREAGSSVHDSYIGIIGAFGRSLLRKGFRVRLLTGDVVDRAAAERLFDELSAAGSEAWRSRLVFEPTHSLHGLMEQIAQTDIVVATRFHNIVCALKLHRPSLSIGYAVKNDMLMAAAGLATFCQHIEALDPALLDQQFARLLAKREMLPIRIRISVDRFVSELSRQEDRLLSELVPCRQCCGRVCGESAGQPAGEPWTQDQ